MVRKIAVLTSGGDAPGMNAAIRAVVRSGLARGMEVYGIYDGYKGLVEGNIVKMERGSVSDIMIRGGTILGTARLPEFKDPKVVEEGKKMLESFGIEAVVCIGGDGTYRGAMALTNLGINCIGVPGTIDNDISSTDYTIGFDTALNTVIEAIDKLRDTSASHHRCSVIEVMGNHCGDIALYSGISSGAEIIISPETGYDEQEIIERIKELDIKRNKRHAIVVISEKMTDAELLAKKISDNTSFSGRATVLGHIQRGGSPSAYDRVLATRMGDKAVEILANGEGGKCVGIRGNEIVSYDIEEALDMTKKSRKQLYELQKRLM